MPGQAFVTATWPEGFSREIVDLPAAIWTQRQSVQTEARPKRAVPTWSATTLSGHKVEIRHRMDLKPLISLCETVDGKRSQICQVVPSHFVDAKVPQKLMIQVASDFVSGVVQMLRSTKMSSS